MQKQLGSWALAAAWAFLRAASLREHFSALGMATGRHGSAVCKSLSLQQSLLPFPSTTTLQKASIVGFFGDQSSASHLTQSPPAIDTKCRDKRDRSCL